MKEILEDFGAILLAPLRRNKMNCKSWTCPSSCKDSLLNFSFIIVFVISPLFFSVDRFPFLWFFCCKYFLFVNRRLILRVLANWNNNSILKLEVNEMAQILCKFGAASMKFNKLVLISAYSLAKS